MLMTDKEIKKAIADGKIKFKNYSADSLQSASYDMRLGNKAIVSGTDMDIDVKKEGGIVLKPGQFALATTLENVTMPKDVAGTIGIKSYYTRKGLILLAGLQIDPGFEGVLVLGLYNASPRKITIEHGDSFCTVEFHQLSTEVEKPYESSQEQKGGEIPRIDKDYLRTIETQSLSELADNMRTLTINVSALTKTVNRFVLPLLVGTFLTIIGTLIAKLF